MIGKALGKAAPDLKFFNMTNVRIAGKAVRALRHGMAGQPGFEFFGPWDDYHAVHEALVRAGEEFGMRQVGGRAYSSNTLESGLDSFAAAGRLLGRQPQGVPAMAAGERLRGVGIDRRQLRLRRYRGLLHDALGPGVWAVRPVRS